MGENDLDRESKGTDEKENSDKPQTLYSECNGIRFLIKHADNVLRKQKYESDQNGSDGDRNQLRRIGIPGRLLTVTDTQMISDQNRTALGETLDHRSYKDKRHEQHVGNRKIDRAEALNQCFVKKKMDMDTDS